MSYWQYPAYVSVGEKRAKAEKKIEQLKKKNKDIQPIIINGTQIANSWWGKAWNSNLTKYSDYSNRIGRGRSYVRHRAVLDLKINPENIKALVSGSNSKPYSIEIKIKPLSKANWKAIKSVCEGKLDSIHGLLTGKIPKAMSDLFTEKEEGLFPSPKEIDFDCSCPDSAYMCKHIAATLFGVGARLDDDPSLFFTLRKINVTELVSNAVKDKTDKLIEKAGKKSARVIADEDISSIFGIELEESSKVKPKKEKIQKKVSKVKAILKTGSNVKSKKEKIVKKTSKAKANVKRTNNVKLKKIVKVKASGKASSSVKSKTPEKKVLKVKANAKADTKVKSKKIIKKNSTTKSSASVKSTNSKKAIAKKPGVKKASTKRSEAKKTISKKPKPNKSGK